MAAAHVIVASLSEPVLDADDAHHLGRVLRLRAGEVVTATDGTGGLLECRYTGGERLEPAGPVEVVSRPGPELTVAFAPVKGDRPEWAVQKLAELGVDRIVVMHAERSVVRWPAERAGGHIHRLRRVVRGAVMQSRQRWLPQVEGVVGFAEAAARPGAALAAPGGGPPGLATPTVLVGPEGGWSDQELGCGAPCVGLGPTVLRAETAAVTAGAVLALLRAGVVGEAG